VKTSSPNDDELDDLNEGCLTDSTNRDVLKLAGARNRARHR
jgi:hypothetical protein